LEQLTSARLADGEQETLEQEKRILENLTVLRNSLTTVCMTLNDGDGSVAEMLSGAERQVASLGDIYEPSGSLSERIESILIEAKDIYETITKDLQRLGGDASGLDEIEERLSLIYTLQQKFRVGSVAELLALQANIQKSLEEIDNSDTELQSLQRQMAETEDTVGQLAEKLTVSRKKTSEMFMASLRKSVAYLGLKNFSGDIEFEQIPFSSTGHDRLHFKVSFNINQKPLLIEETASGGELSRLMLCIKSIIAEKMQLPTIIFDEIDTGVSGEVADKIGKLMKKISENIQVITITHLPQVAALGVQHYKVFKQDTATETLTRMKVLDEEGRIRELAGMLSGAEIDNAAIENAKSLMKIS